MNPEYQITKPQSPRQKERKRKTMSNKVKKLSREFEEANKRVRDIVDRGSFADIILTKDGGM
jgi:hypothetical protein